MTSNLNLTVPTFSFLKLNLRDFKILLTYNGENNNHKIKNIPAYGKIIMAEGDELQHTLSSEQHNEHQVDA